MDKYELTSGQVYAMWGVVAVAVVMVIWAVIASNRAHDRFWARIDSLLALPPASVMVWVENRIETGEYGEYSMRTLCYRVVGESTEVISQQEWYMKEVCRRFIRAGRTVRGVPAEWGLTT